MKKVLILVTFLMSTMAFASAMRDLSNEEINAANWLLLCPSEATYASAHGEWVGAGRFFSDRIGSRMSFRFLRRTGFTTSQYTTTLHVSKIRLANPPEDHRGYQVKCELATESQD